MKIWWAGDIDGIRICIELMYNTKRHRLPGSGSIHDSLDDFSEGGVDPTELEDLG
jgi:hypothetical protein